ncbi:MAG: hypothetical protein LBQ35_06270 [Spirochaetaceae bacterium]|jgi:ParB family chromosome partitioning protein|nr:hypothetical protein [Spirochaetaceae bacterium]
MARLETPETAGWNAGRNYYAKPVRVADVVIEPEIARIFKIENKTFLEIKEKIEKFGYDKSQPVVIWKGRNILVDGHTRLAAAKELGLDEIPAAEMEFADMEEAMLYTFERQVLRRNLTSSEILQAAQMIHGRKKKDGTGRAAEQLAERIGVSPSTIYQARKILLEAPEEELKAVQSGEKTIGAVYKQITKPRRGKASAGTGAEAAAASEKESRESADYQTGIRNKFLRSAVIHLIAMSEAAPARLLVDHFLKKGEKAVFYALLPGNTRKALIDEV